MAIQVFKKQKLNSKNVVKNILSVYNNAPTDVQKSNWYRDANEFCKVLSVKHNVTLHDAVAVVSALSPQKMWDENKRLAVDFLKGKKHGQTTAMLNKAENCLGLNNDGAILNELNGPKISAFYLNIFHHHQTHGVTIDRHAQDIALGHTKLGKDREMTPKQYTFFENCYKEASEIVGVLPHQLQAVTWIHWRNLKSEQRTNNAPKFDEVPF